MELEVGSCVEIIYFLFGKNLEKGFNVSAHRGANSTCGGEKKCVERIDGETLRRETVSKT